MAEMNANRFPCTMANSSTRPGIVFIYELTNCAPSKDNSGLADN